MDEYEKTIAYFSAFCLVLHHVIAPILSARLFPRYNSLTWALKMEWNSRIVSSFHAILTSLMASYALLVDTHLWSYQISGSSHVGKITLALSTGYMICDFISMPIYWRGMELYIYFLHHSVSALAFYISMKYEVLIFYALVRLTSEYSTPFANQRWFYLQIGHHKRTPEMMICTLLFSIFFVLFRNVTIPFYWFLVVRVSKKEHFFNLMYNFPLAFVVWMVSSIILDCLNLHWGRKVAVKGIRVTQLLFSHAVQKLE